MLQGHDGVSVVSAESRATGGDADVLDTRHHEKTCMLVQALDIEGSASCSSPSGALPDTPVHPAQSHLLASPLMSLPAETTAPSVSTEGSRQQEEAQYGWRYPALCSARRTNEDLIMCCARLMEEAAGGIAVDGAAVAEARLFMDVYTY